MPKLDVIDRKLLRLLQDNDRLGLAELAKAVDAPVSTVNDRIKRLVRQGLISGFRASLSPEAFGVNLLAFIKVSWSNPKVEPVFLSRMRASPVVQECHYITGSWNYLLKVRVRRTADIEEFLRDTVTAVEGVERTETLIVLSTAKETWKLAVPDDDD